jgi:hypothetical protein
VAAARGDETAATAAIAEALRLAEKARIPRLVRKIQQRQRDLLTEAPAETSVR